MLTIHIICYGNKQSRNLNDESYKHLEEKYNENWTWDEETKLKVQGLFAAQSGLNIFRHFL